MKGDTAQSQLLRTAVGKRSHSRNMSAPSNCEISTIRPKSTTAHPVTRVWRAVARPTWAAPHRSRAQRCLHRPWVAQFCVTVALLGVRVLQLLVRGLRARHERAAAVWQQPCACRCTSHWERCAGSHYISLQVWNRPIRRLSLSPRPLLHRSPFPRRRVRPCRQHHTPVYTRLCACCFVGVSEYYNSGICLS